MFIWHMFDEHAFFLSPQKSEFPSKQKKQQFLYFAGVIATFIFLVFKVEINFSLH